MEDVHNELNASIYRFSNVGSHFKTMLWIPKFLAQLGRSVATESSVFVIDFCRSLQFSVPTCSLGFFLDYVAKDFDNVATRIFLFSLSILLRQIFLCRDRISLIPEQFLSQKNFFLSRQTFLLWSLLLVELFVAT